jgi:hypothetical protein
MMTARKLLESLPRLQLVVVAIIFGAALGMAINIVLMPSANTEFAELRSIQADVSRSECKANRIETLNELMKFRAVTDVVALRTVKEQGDRACDCLYPATSSLDGSHPNGWSCSVTSTRQPNQADSITATKWTSMGRVVLDEKIGLTAPVKLDIGPIDIDALTQVRR